MGSEDEKNGKDVNFKAPEELSTETQETSNVVWGKDLGPVHSIDLEKIVSENPGWRLPTVKELKDAQRNNVPGFISGSDYWSGEREEGVRTNFVVMGGSGTVNYENTMEGVTRVMLVREEK